MKEFNEGLGIELNEDERITGVSGNVAISYQGEDIVSIAVWQPNSPDVFVSLIPKSMAIDLFERMIKILK